MDIDSLADFHICHGLVKSADHHSCAADKLQCLAAVIGGIKLCSVIEGSPVVDFDVLSGIFSFQNYLGSTAAASASAAAAVTFGAVFTAAFAVPAVVAALMALTVMIAVGTCGNQGSVEKILNCLVRIALGACYHRDACLLKRVHGASAKAAADHDLNCTVCQKSGQSAMADTVGTDHFAGDDFAVFNVIYFKILCSSEVLEDISVIISNCYFHLLCHPLFFLPRFMS